MSDRLIFDTFLFQGGEKEPVMDVVCLRSASESSDVKIWMIGVVGFIPLVHNIIGWIFWVCRFPGTV